MKKIVGLIAAGALFATVSANASAQSPKPAMVASHGAPITRVDTENPLDPASLALAHQILTIAFPPERRSQMMASIMDSIVEQTRKNMQSQMPAGDKEFQALLDRSTQRMLDQMKASMNAALPDYFESFAHAYARGFSRDDLEAILAFAKTPTGQRYFERAPGLLKDPDVQAAGQRMSAQLLAKLPEITRETMRDVEEYVAAKKKREQAVDSTPVS